MSQQGHVGQVRFCLRMDLSLNAYGSCQTEELTGVVPSGCDILLVAKHRMADASPAHVKCVMSAATAASLRKAFEQPSGVSERRPIAVKVGKSIEAYAPRCAQQGIISQDAAAYLIAWCRGESTRKARPISYSILERRPPSPLDRIQHERVLWQRPRRCKNLNLSCRADDGESASLEEDEGPVGLDAAIAD